MAKTAFFSFLFFSLLISGFAKPLSYQTLTVGSLPKQPTHNPDDLSWTESQTVSLPEETDSILTVRLEHRDALAVNATPESLFSLRLQRDAVRAKTLTATATAGSNAGNRINGRNATRVHGNDFSSSVTSGLSQGSGEYFTRLGVGTPPRYVYMVLDTGSDIVWLQCLPCLKCYTQSDPIFDPKRSSSFHGLPCNAPVCRNLDVSGCNKKNSCLYQVSYGDGSFTVGEYSMETLTFRGTKVGNVAFGCGHDNEGLFVGAGGLLGLGRGKLAFPAQAAQGTKFGSKFSYCLVDRTSSKTASPSSIVFGESSVSKKAVFTTMISNPRLDTFYYLELIGLSVGGARVQGITASLFKLDPAGNGGVIIDSGTSVTRLTHLAYIGLRDAFRVGTKGLKSAPQFSLFDTCYDLSGQTEVKVPTVVMHFGGGADVALPAANYLIPVNSKGTFCFAFAGTSGGLSIIGNIQQQGFRVVFDNAGSRIGFASHGCA
ncbi:hypothetical protein GIB67_001577 [Kingdonia uniflora]|uniref:Peptidase A1 domain-containing protein n=1 Tax=Kingdonia uniflora TaxID=39325 RepID=A0A7J7L0Q9_9MAGN|nr:hypothetical protein GIB67_001577 [Kingdonia uniflora]